MLFHQTDLFGQFVFDITIRRVLKMPQSVCHQYLGYVDHNKLRFFMVKHFHNNPLYKNLQMRNWFLCKLKLTKIKDKLSEC